MLITAHHTPSHPYRNILQEYNHTLERSRTLSQAVDCVLAEKATPTNIVSEDDVLMYLRWMVYQQHVSKHLEGFVRVSPHTHTHVRTHIRVHAHTHIQSLQWYPMLHYQQFSNALVSSSPSAHQPADRKVCSCVQTLVCTAFID